MSPTSVRHAVTAKLPHRRSLLLELDLTQLPVEPEGDDVLARLSARGRRLLRPTLRALHEAGEDGRVGGLVVKVGGALPWAPMQELRAGLTAFAASGKPMVAWAETFADGPGEMAGYVLATACRRICLQPGGGLALLGVGVETNFLRGTLDKLGIEPEFEQRYEYKSAADRFMRREFTQPHRESLQRLADSTYDWAVAAIGADRGLTPERVVELIDSGPRTAAEALSEGLVDQLAYRDQVYAQLKRAIAPEASEGTEVDDHVELLFADRWRPRRRPFSRTGPGHVAVVEARGAIMSGRSRGGPMGRQLGSDTTAGQLRAALEDDHAKAVVLKVDSPGGSAVASEVIWREVVRLREVEKPVVVSMGSLAASGGYYISCAADVIVALPSTLTGSIGVLGGKFVIEELLERIGLGTGMVQQGERAFMYSARKPFSEAERERFAHALDVIYTDFVTKVADGRHRSYAEIDGLARGRVWTGADALQRGLVDELGGLRDAVRIARLRADLPETAPARPAVRVGVLDRFVPVRNSEDPRAASAGRPQLADLTALTRGLELMMPSAHLR